MVSRHCPSCEQPVTRLSLHGVEAGQLFGRSGWKAITLSCPSCGVVLGAQIDPVALKREGVDATADEVAKKLRGR